MSKQLNFPRDILLTNGAGILVAANAHPELGPRFRASLLTETATLLDEVTAGINLQKKEIADTGDLTQEQNAALLVMNDKTAAARKTAAKAFAGDTVKLHEEFQVGQGRKGYRLSAVVERARIVLAGCQNPENIPGMAAKGWLDTDTTALADAIATLTSTDETQETSKTESVAATSELESQSLDLLEHVTTIQAACDLQYPERDPANAAVRKEFRLDTFPPKQTRKPNTPRNLIVNPGTPGNLFADWDDTANTNDYIVRVTNKASGDELAKLTVEDSETTIALPGTPAGTEVDVTVTARNTKGEGDPTEPVTATVP